MVNNFRDDEPVAAKLQPNSGPTAEDFVAGKIAARIINKPDAPLMETDYKLVVELLGSETGDGRSGADIVTVLDVSGSMGGIKMDKLKISMKYLIKKLTPIDRLSIVTFHNSAFRLSPLLAMNENAQAKIETIIDGLQAGGGTNITGGLEMALEVLEQRTVKEGRTSAVMLMSDGQQNDGYGDPTKVPAGAVPIHTFGLGNDHDIKVLEGIAKSSNNNGTYSVADVEGSNSASLNIAFSACLAGVLNVVVDDLVLNITALEDDIEIKLVSAGNYNQSRIDNSVTISFGNLYSTEKRTASVLLKLPAVDSRSSEDILRIAYSYRPSGGKKDELYEAPPLLATVTRTAGPLSPERDEVVLEDARQNTGKSMKTARELADMSNFDLAKTTLQDAEKLLDNLNRETDELIKAFKYDIQEFFKLLKDPQTYHKEGRAFALSAELSYGLQRFAARGDATQLLALAIPIAAVFAKEAAEFDKDPTITVRTAEEDNKVVAEVVTALVKEFKPEEDNKDMSDIVRFADFVNVQLSQAFESLKAVYFAIITRCSPP